MTPPTPEELLRLARKVAPGARPPLIDVYELLICSSTGAAICIDDP